MSANIASSNLVEFNGEPRILDIDLGFSLGMKNPTAAVRQMIERNRDELEMHGGVFSRPVKNSDPLRRGRPGKAYYLNEGQALVICALSRTPIAAQIRKTIIDVFMAYRQGKVVHVREHHRTSPRRDNVRHASDGTFTGSDSEFRLQYEQLLIWKEHEPNTILQFLARTMIKVKKLETALAR